MSIDDLARASAAYYHVNADHLVKTMKCESHGDAAAVGDHGRTYGLMQFHQDTFDWMKGLAIKAGEPFQTFAYKNPESQLKLAAWAFANGYAGHWSCYHIEAARGWT